MGILKLPVQMGTIARLNWPIQKAQDYLFKRVTFETGYSSHTHGPLSRQF
jgi:hypothetical protein